MQRQNINTSRVLTLSVVNWFAMALLIICTGVNTASAEKRSKLIQKKIYSEDAQKISNISQWKPWFIAGPTLQNQTDIHRGIDTDNIVRVVVNKAVDQSIVDKTAAELELNIMVTDSGDTDGAPTKLPDDSRFVEITYRSTQVISLQARQGHKSGNQCIHGGSHSQIELPASPQSFTKITIPWSEFQYDHWGSKLALDTSNICKFNFVNYNPVQGAELEISSIVIDKFNR